jgi:hypothetical protein
MVTKESIQQAFSLAYSLHPQRVVAWEVTREALRQYKVRASAQGERPAANSPYKQRLDENNLLRTSIFISSEKWERDQESRSPKRDPVYVPTLEDLWYRYLKTLVWHSMDRKSIYAAVAIGALLFTYQTSEIASVSVDFFDSENIRRVKNWFLRKLESRFSDVMVIFNDSGRHNAPPLTEYQLAFVNKALSVLAPQMLEHPDSCATNKMLLNEFFSYESTRLEQERVHILLNTECGGWARLVNEYNQLYASFPSRHLGDPSDKLRLPIFGNGFNGPQDRSKRDDASSVLEGRFKPDPLNHVEIRSLIQRLNESPSSGEKGKQDIAA